MTDYLVIAKNAELVEFEINKSKKYQIDLTNNYITYHRVFIARAVNMALTRIAVMEQLPGRGESQAFKEWLPGLESLLTKKFEVTRDD